MLLKPITKFPDVHVSTCGRAFKVVDGKVVLEYSLWTDAYGYKNVTIKRSCVGKKIRANLKIHRLVYEAHVGPLIDGLCICHLNGIRDDNRIGNLSQETMAVNHSHKKLHGTQPFGDASTSSVHTSSEILSLARSIQSAKRDTIGRLWRGEIDRLCRQHGVKRSTVRHLIHGEAWGDTLADANIAFPAIKREIQCDSAHS